MKARNRYILAAAKKWRPFDYGFTIDMLVLQLREMLKLYTDGKFVAIKDNVILLDRPKRLVLGGDIYADSFEGFVDSLTFYDYVLDQKEIEKMYEQQI